MKTAHLAALGFVLALALVALAPTASAQGMILDPDGTPSAWTSFVDWLAGLFGDAGPAQDPAG